MIYCSLTLLRQGVTLIPSTPRGAFLPIAALEEILAYVVTGSTNAMRNLQSSLFLLKMGTLKYLSKRSFSIPLWRNAFGANN